MTAMPPTYAPRQRVAEPALLAHPLPAYGQSHAFAHGMSRLRTSADVIGGIIFAIVVFGRVLHAASDSFLGAGFGPSIGWEGLFVVAALLCSVLLPSGIVPQVDLRTTITGLVLDWPDLAYAGYYLYLVVSIDGLPNGLLGPIAFALAIGFAEEFLFRVMLLGWLVTRLAPEKALVVSSIVFGLAHLQQVSMLGLANVIPQTAGGFVLGAIYLRTRNPLSVILCHAFFDLNGTIDAGTSIAGGSVAWGLPSMREVALWSAFMVYGLYLVRHGTDVAGRRRALPAPAT